MAFFQHHTHLGVMLFEPLNGRWKHCAQTIVFIQKVLSTLAFWLLVFLLISESESEYFSAPGDFLWPCSAEGCYTFVFFFVFVEQKRVSTLESLPIVILIFAFISQVHYFVIITNPKSSSLSRYLSFFLSLSLSPLWFHECWNWILHLKVNFHDGITQISLPLFRLYASIPLSFMLHNLDASLHLLWFNLFIWRHLFFFMLNSPAHVFPLCIVMLPLSKSACMCVCALAHKFLIQTFQIWK